MQEGIFPEVTLQQGLALCVDSASPEGLRIGHEGRQEAPEHHVKCPHAFLLIPDDDRLHRLRRDVIVRGKLQVQAVNVAQLEGFAIFCLSARLW